MRRVNIYLEDERLDVLRRIAATQGRAVAEIVREALDLWMQTNDVRTIGPDEWTRRLDALLVRRDAVAERSGWDQETVERDVSEAVRAVRRRRPARRR